MKIYPFLDEVVFYKIGPWPSLLSRPWFVEKARRAAAQTTRHREDRSTTSNLLSVILQIFK
jgi:hypothetical protein